MEKMSNLPVCDCEGAFIAVQIHTMQYHIFLGCTNIFHNYNVTRNESGSPVAITMQTR